MGFRFPHVVYVLLYVARGLFTLTKNIIIDEYTSVSHRPGKEVRKGGLWPAVRL